MALAALITENMSGVCLLKATQVNESLIIPRPKDGTITTDILGAGGAKPAWETIPFTEATCAYGETEVIIDGVLCFKQVVQFEIPQDNASRAKEIERISRTAWVLDITDMNGVRRVVGDKDAGAVFSVLSRTTHDDHAQRNGRYCQFSVTHRKRSPIYAPPA
jgi:hypothetical protein